MTKDLKSINELADMNILYVEDDKFIAEAFIPIISRIVKSVHHCTDGKMGLEAFKTMQPDIIITDIKMPVMNGLEMSRVIRQENDDIPIIIVTAYNETEFLKDAFAVGITYYLNKPVNRLVMLRTLNESAKSVVYKRQQEEVIQNYEESIDAFVDLIEKRDRYTAGHSNRVAKYCVIIAEAMNIDAAQIALLEKAAKLHDIGKIEIPDAILLNPSKLSKLEYAIVQEHLNSGYEVLSKIKQYKELAEIMRHHHEHYDGSGYPQGLKGDEIPILSKIMMIADAFDAMTTNRVYKPRMSIKEAIAEIISLSGIQFHPDITPIATSVLSEIQIESFDDQMPKNQLEEKKFSYFFSDLLTGLFNENYFQSLVAKRVNSTHKADDFNHVTIIDLNKFSQYNKKHGWEEGNMLMKKIANYLHVKFSDKLLFRIRGDLFYILSSEDIPKTMIDLNTILQNSEVSFQIYYDKLENFVQKKFSHEEK